MILVLRMKKWSSLSWNHIDCAGLLGDKSIGFACIYATLKDAKQAYPNLMDNEYVTVREPKDQFVMEAKQ